MLRAIEASQQQQENAVLLIRKGLVNHAQIADVEIVRINGFILTAMEAK